MNLNLKKLIIIASTLTLMACEQESELSKSISKLKMNEPADVQQAAPELIGIRSLDDLTLFFSRVDYSLKSWQEGNRAVPRVTFSHVPKEWQYGSKKLPVKEKKEIFFKLMLPLILRANEEIAAEHKLASTADLSSPKLIKLAKKYKLLKADAKVPELSKKMRQKLLYRIGEVPPSLALAQAAEESGWATSRFTVEGNAFFGQWDFSGKGMKPKHQRKNLGDYGLARFDTPLDSVRAYMLNINTGKAYESLRAKRAKAVANNKKVTGLSLASTLDKYSERGKAYTESLKSLIKYNKLQSTDDGFLTGKSEYQLITGIN